MRVPRVVTTGGVDDGCFGIKRSVLIAGRARMSCTDKTAGRATISRSATWMASATCGEWPGDGGQGASSIGRGVPMTGMCALRVNTDAVLRLC